MLGAIMAALAARSELPRRGPGLSISRRPHSYEGYAGNTELTSLQPKNARLYSIKNASFLIVIMGGVQYYTIAGRQVGSHVVCQATSSTTPTTSKSTAEEADILAHPSTRPLDDAKVFILTKSPLLRCSSL